MFTSVTELCLAQTVRFILRFCLNKCVGCKCCHTAKHRPSQSFLEKKKKKILFFFFPVLLLSDMNMGKWSYIFILLLLFCLFFCFLTATCISGFRFFFLRLYFVQVFCLMCIYTSIYKSHVRLGSCQGY